MRLLLSVIAVVVSLAVSACQGPCDEWARLSFQCGVRQGGESAQRALAGQCRAMREHESETPEMRDGVVCATKAENCDGFTACRNASRAQRDATRIAALTQQGAHEEALATCEGAPADIRSDAQLANTCKDAATQALEAWSSARKALYVEDLCRRDWVTAHSSIAARCSTLFASALEQAIAGGKYYALKSHCESSFGLTTKAGKSACKRIIGQTREALEKELVAIRDGTTDDTEAYVACQNLRTVIKALKESNADRVETLCEEAEAGTALRKALARVDRELKKEKQSLPWACDSAMDKLRQILPSDWQKAAKKTLIQRCYVDLGARILAEKVPGMTYCDYTVETMLARVKTHQISAPEVTRWVEPAKARCKPQP